jgi:hypothetical protein
VLAAIVALAVAWGCGTSATVKRTVILKPVSNANYGRPFYVLIRSVTEKEFLTDNYDKVAKMVYPNSEDPSVLKVALVWPDLERKIEVDVPKDKPVGIYCIFTSPGNPWKMLLAPPLKSKLKAVLKRRTVSSGSTRND